MKLAKLRKALNTLPWQLPLLMAIGADVLILRKYGPIISFFQGLQVALLTSQFVEIYQNHKTWKGEITTLRIREQMVFFETITKADPKEVEKFMSGFHSGPRN